VPAMRAAGGAPLLVRIRILTCLDCCFASHTKPLSTTPSTAPPLRRLKDTRVGVIDTSMGALANLAFVTTSWVCAILDERGLWNHLRGITGRETLVTVWKLAAHRGAQRTGQGIVKRGFTVKSITSFLHREWRRPNILYASAE
jgi:hypothetical protein